MAILGRIRKKKDSGSNPGSRNVSASSNVSAASNSTASTPTTGTPIAGTPQSMAAGAFEKNGISLAGVITKPLSHNGTEAPGGSQVRQHAVVQQQQRAPSDSPHNSLSGTYSPTSTGFNTGGYGLNASQIQGQGPTSQGQVQEQSQPQSQSQSPRRVMSNQYPWSQHFISNASPFPRYGHAANYIAARDGEVFVMGGLKGSDVFGDLWVIESDTLVGYLLDTENCPSPRVGHASLTLGNAFIVFGGDTKVDESDKLDDGLYLLNTTTLKWTLANPAGQKPCGRYGHTLSAVGSKIYVFGGQMDDYFFNDLIAYDLTTLRSPESKWELIIPASGSPPARTNHTIIAYQDKLYLFGGTDGQFWYSDTWVFDPSENSWTQLECSGFLPAPCEGHSATIIGDIMYVFGGRSAKGEDLSTLSALKLTSRKWFTFQNLGPGPSPRAGHSMTAFGGSKILVMGGEGVETEEETDSPTPSAVYVLDISRITYPPDRPQQKLSAPGAFSSPADANKSLQNSPQNRVKSPIPTVQIPQSTPLVKSQTASPIDVNNNGVGMPQLSRKEPDAGFSSDDKVNSGNGKLGNGKPGAGLGSGLGVVAGAGAGAAAAAVNGMSKGLTNTGLSGITKSASNRSLGAPFDDKSREHSIINSYDYDEDDLKSTYESAENLQNQLQNSSDTTAAANRAKQNKIVDGEPSVPSTPGEPPLNGEKPQSVSEDIDTPTLRNKSRPLTASTISTVSAETEATDAAGENLQTSRANVVRSVEPTSELNHARELGPGEAAETPVEPGQVKTVDEALERLKASNSWYESELAAAKNAGYVPSSRPPVDVLKLRRVSQRITQDTSSSLTERDILLTAMQEIKHELQVVQERFQQQAEVASERIKVIEKERDDYKRQAENHPATRDLHQQIQTHSDRLVLLEHERSHLTEELSKWQNHAKDIEEVTDSHVVSLQAAGDALSQAQSQVSLLHSQVKELTDANSSLKANNAELSAKIVQLQSELEDHQEQSSKYRDLADEHVASADKSHLALTSGIQNIVNLWNEKKAAHHGGTRSIDDSKAELEDRLKGIHEKHEDDVSKLQQELSELKEQLAEATSTAAVHEEKSTGLQRQLEDHGVQQQDYAKQISQYEAQLSALKQDNESRAVDLQKDHESHVKAVEAEYQDRVKELEQQYESSLQVFENQEVAFKKLREELTKYKDHNVKLQSELEELQLQERENRPSVAETDSTTSATSTPVLGTRISSLDSPKYNQRNMELQLKDVKLQLVMLQEEKDEIEAKAKELRKKHYSKDSELQELKAQNEFLQSKLEGVISGGTTKHADSETSQTIDSLNSELDSLREHRSRLSS